MSSLNDKTVIPSYLSMLVPGFLRDSGIQTNHSLRYGEVKEVIYPKDPRNTNGRYIEYSVDVTSKDGMGPRTTVRYYACTLSNPFGGGADLYRYVLRHGKASSPLVTTGSKVLILCLEGEQSKGIIIGGVRDANFPATVNQGTDTDEGLNLYWEYNGLIATVDKQGAFTLTFTGPTKNDGTFDDSMGVFESDTGSLFNLQADGSVLISSGGPAETQQNLQMDNDKNTFTVVAAKELNIHGQGTWTATIQDDIKLQSEQGAFEIDADGNCSIISAGLLVGKATDNFILGKTYRRAEARMNGQVLQALQQASTALLAASSALATSAAAAAAPVAQAATAIQAAVNAIQTFESGASKYLSTVNFSD